MADAASRQAIDIGKERLREFLETSETGRQAMAMSGEQRSGRVRDADEISMDTLNGDGKKKTTDDDLDDI
jgi:hypothetical protein